MTFVLQSLSVSVVRQGNTHQGLKSSVVTITHCELCNGTNGHGSSKHQLISLIMPLICHISAGEISVLVSINYEHSFPPCTIIQCSVLPLICILTRLSKDVTTLSDILHNSEVT